MAELTKDQVKEWLGNLSVLELSELVSELEEAWGVSAAAPVAVAAVGGAGGDGGGAAAEKTEFDVILASIGDKKIQVIKAVRELTGLGLKEAKDMVDGAPNAIKEGVTKDEADEVKTRLEEAGATVEVK